MTASAATERVAHLVDPRGLKTIDVLGPTIQYLTATSSTFRAMPSTPGATSPGSPRS